MSMPFMLQARAKLAYALCASIVLVGCANTIQNSATAALDCDDRYTRCAPEVKPTPRIQIVENILQKPLKETAEPLNTFMITPPVIAPILFEFDASTALRINLREVVQFLQDNRDVTVTLHGYTDPLGSEDYNQQLSYQRAAHIRERLLVAGVSRTQITVEAHGEQDLKIPEMSETQVGSKEMLIMLYRENRRVTFEFNVPNTIAQHN